MECADDGCRASREPQFDGRAAAAALSAAPPRWDSSFIDYFIAILSSGSIECLAAAKSEEAPGKRGARARQVCLCARQCTRNRYDYRHWQIIPSLPADES